MTTPSDAAAGIAPGQYAGTAHRRRLRLRCASVAVWMVTAFTTPASAWQPGLQSTASLMSAQVAQLSALAPELDHPQGYQRDIPSSWQLAQSGAPDAPARPARQGSWPEMESRRSYAIPALEILGFQFLLNRFDKAFVGSDYNVSWNSIRRNWHSKWVVDN